MKYRGQKKIERNGKWGLGGPPGSKKRITMLSKKVKKHLNKKLNEQGRERIKRKTEK